MDERITKNALFQGMADDAAHQLHVTIKEQLADEGHIIFEEGDPGEDMFLILDGEVVISIRARGGDQETLRLLSSGDFFGEMAMLDGGARSARATATKPTILGKINRDELHDVFSRTPEAALQFARLATSQLRTANTAFVDKLIQTERLSLLGTMMSKMVHDFRNPIATLGMISYNLLQREDAQLAELGQIAEDSVERIKAMIDELLDFSRGHSHLTLTSTTVPALMEKLDTTILRRIEGAGIAVIRDIGYHGEITVDRERLLRLFENILKNAWEACRGNGELQIRVSRPTDDRIEFRIADNGCGIPPEILAKVFEPFVTHGKSNGTGLGMAIAKSVVEAHRGEIRMESAIDEGTTCFIELPMKPEA